MTNWVDVADTAVKIGLGALLGGVFSIVLAWLSHKQSTSRDYFKRRRELIEGIVDDLDRFYRSMSLFRSSLQNLLFIKNSQQPMTEEHLKAIKILEEKVYLSFSDLYIVRSRLILVDEDSLERHVDRFIRHAGAFFRIANIENENLTAEKIEKYKSNLDERRKKILSGLSDAYKKGT
ncbi:MAG TPA: hypothetical protein VF297_10595 [Pyrinomonadaceae bacterium]